MGAQKAAQTCPHTCHGIVHRESLHCTAQLTKRRLYARFHVIYAERGLNCRASSWTLTMSPKREVFCTLGGSTTCWLAMKCSCPRPTDNDSGSLRRVRNWRINVLPCLPSPQIFGAAEECKWPPHACSRSPEVNTP